MTPQIGGNETASPTVSLNGTDSVDVTKSFTERVSFSLYSITYDIEDNEMPSREEDISELTAVTESTFELYMEEYFEEFPLSILVGFETEFVRTGVNVQNKLFVVFRSVALFDKGSFVIPEAEQLELTLQEALQQDELLWMEYVAALQELNPKNAFSGTVNVVYAADPPPESKPRLSVAESSSALAAIAVAAAGVTIVAIGLFVIRRKRKAASDLLGDESIRPEKQTRHSRSLFRNRVSNCSDTGSETYNASLEGLQTVPLTSTLDSTVEVDEENGSIGNDSSVYISGEQSTKADDWSKYKTYSIDRNESEDDCSEYSDDAIASKADDSFESKSLLEEKSRQSSHILHPWKEAPGRDRSRKAKQETAKYDGELTERQRGGNLLSTESSEHKKKLAQQRSEEEAKKLEEKKLAVERAKLEDWLKKEQMARLEDEKRLSEDLHKAEIAKIDAEDAARKSNELRLKEEERFLKEKEAFEARLKQTEIHRKHQEKRLLAAKANFEEMIRKEKEERALLELQLIQEKTIADKSLKRAMKRAKDAERKLQQERQKLMEAKQAMEAKQQQLNDDAAFLEEEEKYLRQLRAAEAAREEDMLASKEATRASDIRKLQQLRFEEKEKDLNTLRLKEAEAAKFAEEIIKANLDPAESQIWDHAKEMLRSPEKSPSYPDSDVDDDTAERLAMALRLAQSWGEAVPSLSASNEDDDTGQKQESICESTSEGISKGDQQEESEDESASDFQEDTNSSDAEEEVDQEVPPEESHESEEEPDKNSKERPSGKNGVDDSPDSEESSVKTNEGAAAIGIQTVKAQSEEPRPKPSHSPSEDTSIVSNIMMPESLKRSNVRKLQESDKVVYKIGPAQFIAPWNDQDEADKEKRRKSAKSGNYKAGSSARVKKHRPGTSGESVHSESTGSKMNGSIQSDATPASVDDDDTCSEFSLRTSTTMSSGFSKILPR